ncbi:CLUMA_CG015731, isoform A [Clunio marinus]|uniref:CLUMA_CG015731, isoform A n=1 Tax=Clunio marinus TaxID=568069 RepID=A0A1J1IRU7_9DIPT|nr:CLUMA_CG015731, isoform A [Clunio marinus]
MEENRKIPIKIAEISIKKFNDQIQHKVIQLRNFRISTSSASNLGDLDKLRKEAINSLRVVKQLKQLLIEIEHLKSQTKSEDHEKFDELTSRRRNEALKEIKLYQDMKPIEKLNELSPSATSDIDYESPSTVQINNDLMQVQLRVDEDAIRRKELESRQALLKEFENLQSECEQISQLYHNVHGLVVEQAPMVEAIAENVEETEIHVEEGTRQLQMALNYKKTIYPILGGFIGACVLGPVGLVAGLKAGGAASVCGGICGYAGGKFLKKANSPSNEPSPTKEDPPDDFQSAAIIK